MSLIDDLADDLEDVDFEDAANADDEGWETEDEMEAEAEQDDSELTFSKHTGKQRSDESSPFLTTRLGLKSSKYSVQGLCSVSVWILPQIAWQ